MAEQPENCKKHYAGFYAGCWLQNGCLKLPKRFNFYQKEMGRIFPQCFFKKRSPMDSELER